MYVRTVELNKLRQVPVYLISSVRVIGNESVKCHYNGTWECISMRGSSVLFGLWLSLGYSPMDLNRIQDNQKRKQDTLFKHYIGVTRQVASLAFIACMLLKQRLA